MTASPPFPQPVHSSRVTGTGFPGKKLSENSRGCETEADALAYLVSRALWLSFPEEHSEDALADAAAPYFRNKRGEPISPRTVKYWLRGDTLPSALHLSTLVMMQPKLFLGFWLGSQS